jgi:hypothetical protein
MRILVVEDDAPLAEFLYQRLAEEQFAVQVVFGGEAERMVSSQQYDLVLLDLNLPGAGGTGRSAGNPFEAAGPARIDCDRRDDPRRVRSWPGCGCRRLRRKTFCICRTCGSHPGDSSASQPPRARRSPGGRSGARRRDHAVRGGLHNTELSQKRVCLAGLMRGF